MTNPYLPMPMRVERSVEETDDGGIRTITLSFTDREKQEGFAFMPGQFAELSIMGAGEAPFGIASPPLPGRLLEFTVSRVGRVTSELHNLEPGDPVGLRGPMGNGWPMEELAGLNVLAVGGGFGFSTLRAFTGYALDPANRGKYRDITVVYGARNPGMLLYKTDLASWESNGGLNLKVTVDRGEPGWTGITGVVPEVVKGLRVDPENTAVLVCGPPAMIRYTLPVLSAMGLPGERIYLSLEMRMKCGIGKCGRCNIGADYVCTDGPVFSLSRLELLPEEY
jgi:NAD(P)H-flavin reductase